MRNTWFIAISLTACAHAACGGGDGHQPPPDAQAPGTAPRQISPLSMTIVTQQQPRLHWLAGAAGEAFVVELCKDRACTMPLPVATQLAGDMQSAVPTAPLPAGWVFWRVSVAGAPQLHSATWQFWVGPSSASTPVDTSNGAILDVNGDGYPDLLVGASGTSTGTGAAHLYLGSATSMADWSKASPTMRIDLLGPQGPGAAFGFSVASAGDVNGDGYADFLIGANAAGAGAGTTYLYLGSATPSAAGWNATPSTQRFDLLGPDGANAYFGHPVVSVGDVNGDGYADFLVGAYRANASAGAAHLYLGSAVPSTTDWNAGSSPRRIDLSDPGRRHGLLRGLAGQRRGCQRGRLSRFPHRRLQRRLGGGSRSPLPRLGDTHGGRLERQLARDADRPGQPRWRARQLRVLGHRCRGRQRRRLRRLPDRRVQRRRARRRRAPVPGLGRARRDRLEWIGSVPADRPDQPR